MFYLGHKILKTLLIMEQVVQEACILFLQKPNTPDKKNHSMQISYLICVLIQILSNILILFTSFSRIFLFDIRVKISLR